MNSRIIRAVVLAAIGLAPLGAQDGDSLSVRRYGLLVASNDGGPDRQTLLFADDDVRSLAGTLDELGGLDVRDQILLFDPDPAAVDDALVALRSAVRQSADARRTEVVFYYSGHSDDQGLLLGGDRYPYGRLRDELDSLGADVIIAILDSCSSGAFTRDKGGVRRSPFLVDDSSRMEGHAYLTSSSADEVSQESDAVGGSFFTHFLVSGLRGAADTTGDGRVTLNEVYQHTYAETLARTEQTLGGPQHPNYDLRLTGTGDLVLTDLTRPTAALLLDEPLEGRVYVRDQDDRLVTELNKRAGQAVTLALPAGAYTVRVLQGDTTLVGTAELARGRTVSFGRDDLSRSRPEFARFRGDAPSEGAAEGDAPTYLLAIPWPKWLRSADDGSEAPDGTLPASFGVLPRLSFPDATRSVVAFQLGFPVASAMSIHGSQVSGLIATVEKGFQGAQVAGLAAYSHGSANGAQVAGLAAFADLSLDGAQVSGAIARTGGTVGGAQVTGLWARAGGDIEGAQVSGLIGTAGGGIDGAQVSGLLSLAGGGVEGAQVSGLLSMTGGDVAGAQVSGLASIAGGDVHGAQVSGLYNRAGNVDGAQVGLINASDGAQGVLVGLVNYSEDMRAFPVGLINISRQGIRDIDFRFEQGGRKYLSFKSGNRYYYTRFLFGFGEFDIPDHPESIVLGWGLGFRATIRPLYLELDLDWKTAFADYASYGSIEESLRNVLIVPTVGLTLGAGGKFGIYGGVGFTLINPWQDRMSVLQTGGTRWNFSESGSWAADVKWYGGVHF